MMQAPIVELKRNMPVIAVYDLTDSAFGRIAFLNTMIDHLIGCATELEIRGYSQCSTDLFKAIDRLSDEQEFLSNLPVIFTGASHGK